MGTMEKNIAQRIKNNEAEGNINENSVCKMFIDGLNDLYVVLHCAH